MVVCKAWKQSFDAIEERPDGNWQSITVDETDFRGDMRLGTVVQGADGVTVIKNQHVPPTYPDTELSCAVYEHTGERKIWGFSDCEQYIVFANANTEYRLVVIESTPEKVQSVRQQKLNKGYKFREHADYVPQSRVLDFNWTHLF